MLKLDTGEREFREVAVFATALLTGQLPERFDPSRQMREHLLGEDAPDQVRCLASICFEARIEIGLRGVRKVVLAALMVKVRVAVDADA